MFSIMLRPGLFEGSFMIRNTRNPSSFRNNWCCMDEGNEAIYLQIPYNSGIRQVGQHSPLSLWNVAILR